MKIIGESKTRFILEANQDEVYNLIGYYSRYRGHDDGTRLRVGDQIKVAEIYMQLYSSKQNDDRKKAAMVALKGIINSLEEIDPVLETGTPEKEEHDE